MKTNLLRSFAMVLIILAGLQVNALAGKPPSDRQMVNAHDSIVVHKQSLSRSHRISMYPDADQKVLFFSVKGEEGRAYQLFVFDLEGKLVRQTEIRNRQTTILHDMEKGDYVFDVFSDDLRIGNGQLTVR